MLREHEASMDEESAGNEITFDDADMEAVTKTLWKCCPCIQECHNGGWFQDSAFLV